jgi:hypothetical protein
LLSNTILRPSSKNINYEALKKQASFYDKNAALFSNIESEYGINPWFLVHFRTYFNSRNQFFEEVISASSLPIKGKLLDFILFFILFVKQAFILKDKSVKQIDKCLISSAYKDPDIHVGKLRESCFNLYYMDIPKIGNIIGQSTLLKRDAVGFGCSNSYLILLLALVNPVTYFRLNRFKGDYKKVLDKLLIETKEDQFFANQLNKLINAQLLRYCEYLGYLKFFKSNSFSSLLLYDENSPTRQVIWKAAKNNGVKVYAIQHGALHDLNPAYNYTYYKNKPVLCDKTFLWGEFYLQKLIDFGYKKESLKVLGPIPTDLFDFDLVQSGKEDWVTQNNPGNKKVICYCTQPQKDERLRLMQLTDVVEAVSNTDYLLLIRPHPAEKLSYFDTILDSIENKGDVVIDGKSNLEVHFSVSSILITSFSTVGIEFLKYYKPILILDYLDEDLLGYIKNGVGVQVQGSDDLKELLSSEITIEKVNYKQFMSDFYQTDNLKVSDKILNFIETN